MNDTTLRITEIFCSLQGEARTSGLVTVFIRLTGCPLRCQYCDSDYAFFGGERYVMADILSRVKSFDAHYVCVTGGEPLAQPACIELLETLCDKHFKVSLETSGAIEIDAVDPRVCVVMDLKTPKSGEMNKNLYQNIERLKKDDQVKFVICDRQDYDWAKFQVDQHQLTERVGDVLFSPSEGQLDAVALANWIVEDRLPIRFQLQLHKQLWGNKPGV